MEPQKIPLNPIPLDPSEQSPYEQPQAVVQQVAPAKRSWNPFVRGYTYNPGQAMGNHLGLKGKTFIAAAIITFLVIASGVGYLLFTNNSHQPTSQPQQAPIIQDNSTTTLTTQHLQINVPLKVVKSTTLSGLTVTDAAEFQAPTSFLQGLKVSGDSVFNGNVTVTGTINGTAIPAGLHASAGPVGSQGPAGQSGTNGTNGAQGPAGDAGCISGHCVSLQAAGPGVQETGNINVSGSVTSNGLLAGVSGSITAGISKNTVDPNASYVYGTAMVTASDGFTRIAYGDGNYGLDYLRCTDATCSSPVIHRILPDNSVENYSITGFMALGTDGFARILYIDYNDYSLKMIRCLDIDCTTFNTDMIDDNSTSNYPGEYGAEILMGSDNLPRIYYGEYGSTYPYPNHFVRCNDADCSTMSNNIVDGSYGYYPAGDMTLGSDGFARIVYEDGNDYSLKMARCLDATCATYNIDTIYADGTNYPGYYGKIIRMGPDGFPRIAYVNDGSTYTLYYTQCTDADCTSPITNTLGDFGYTDANIGMALNATGNAVIVVPSADYTELIAVVCSTASCNTRNQVVVENNSEYLGYYGISVITGNNDLPQLTYGDDNNGEGLRLVQFVTADGQAQLQPGSNIGSPNNIFGSVYSQNLTLSGDGTSTSTALQVLDDTAKPVATISGHGDLTLTGNLSSSGKAVFGNDQQSYFTSNVSLSSDQYDYMTTADLNGDGKHDYISIYACCSLTISQPDGTYQATRLTGPANTDNATHPNTPDLNGDGKPDLLYISSRYDYANSRYDPKIVDYINNNGTFTEHDYDISGQIGYGSANDTPVAIGDFNHDSKQDIAFIFNYEIWVFMSNGDGSFAAAVGYPTVTNATYTWQDPPVAADVNGDNATDLVITDGSGIDVYLNNGNGTFALPGRYTNGNSDYLSESAERGGIVKNIFRALDVNGDNKPDILTRSTAGLLLFINNGDGTFAAPITYQLGSVETITTADFNNDNKTDIMAAVPNQFPKILLGNGTAFDPPQTIVTDDNISSLRNDYALAVADINSDGYPDLVSSSYVNSSGYIEVFLNIDGKHFSAPTGQVNFRDYPDIIDYNGDQKPDFVLYTTLTNGPTNLYVFLNNYTSVKPQVLISTSDPNSVSLLIQTAPGQTSNALQVQGADGNTSLSVNANGQVVINPQNIASMYNAGTVIGSKDNYTGGLAVQGTPNQSQYTNIFAVAQSNSSLIAGINNGGLLDLHGDGLQVRSLSSAIGDSYWGRSGIYNPGICNATSNSSTCDYVGVTTDPAFPNATVYDIPNTDPCYGSNTYSYELVIPRDTGNILPESSVVFEHMASLSPSCYIQLNVYGSDYISGLSDFKFYGRTYGSWKYMATSHSGFIDNGSITPTNEVPPTTSNAHTTLLVQSERTQTTPVVQVQNYLGDNLLSVGSNGSILTPGDITSNSIKLIPSGEFVWVEDSLPAGASAQSDGGDSWNWVGSNPAPYTGSLASQSNIAAGEHQHYFTGATRSMSVSSGDKLYAYVYLDPVNTPSEVMLQWHANDGSGWSHRATWGADSIGFGTRYQVGALPATGQWVRLEVPASSVGMEGKTADGMAFTLYGGKATWDHAGRVSSNPVPPSTSLQVQDNSGNITTSIDSVGNLNIAGSLYIGGNLVCNSSGCVGGGGGGGFYIANGTGTQSGNFAIQSASSSSIGGVIKAANGQTADLLELQSSTGAVPLKVTANGSLVSSDTTNSYFTATLNNGQLSFWAVGGNLTATLYQQNNAPALLASSLGFLTQNSIASAPTFITKGAASQTGDLLQAQDSTGAILAKIDSGGSITVKNATINGTLSVNGHIITGGTALGAGDVVVNANAGTGASCAATGFNDTGGQITLVTGSGGYANGVQCTLSFKSSYLSAPHPVISSANTTDTTSVKPYVSATTTTFTINFITADSSAHTFKFNYFIAQ